jgi:hypothetical protein
MSAKRGSTRPWELECKRSHDREWKRFASTKYSTSDRALEAARRFAASRFYPGLTFRAKKALS